MTHSPDQVTYTKLGTNLGKPRIWIEGAKLSVAGFTRHASYSVCDHADGVCSTIAHQILGQSVDFIQALMVGMAVHTHLKNNV